MTIHMIVAILIFAVIYALFVMEKMNKAVAVLLGASLYLVFHFIPFHEAVEHIDMNVIFLPDRDDDDCENYRAERGI